MAAEQQAIEQIMKIVSRVEYNRGEINRRYKLFDEVYALRKLEVYPSMVDVDKIITTIDDEMRKVDKVYHGKIPDEDQIDIAKKIHSILKSYPIEYKFYFEMPSGYKPQRDVRIGEGKKLFVTTDDFINEINEQNKLTYLRHPFSLKTLLATKEYVEDAVPNITEIKPDRLYLEIEAIGFAGTFGTTMYDIDPIHVFKLLIAYLEVNVILGYSSLHGLVGANPNQRSLHNTAIYKKNLEFVTEITRPNDEINFMKKLDFMDDITDEILIQKINEFNKLINVNNNEYLEIERNKIINSLYWYIEGQISETTAFKTLMNVSMFDSFFDNADGKEKKARSISKLINKDTGELDKNEAAIIGEYKYRNEIAHGKTRLLEIGHQAKQSSNFHRYEQIKLIYQSFIKIKIKKLLA